MSSKTVFKSAVAGILAALFLAMAGCDILDPYFIRVEFIEGVPEAGEAGTPLALTGTIRPAFASNKDIVWSVKDAGNTGATISGNTLNAASGGTVTIRAFIANGVAAGKEYTQDFNIEFIVPKVITNIVIKTQPKLAYTEGDTLDLSGIVVTLTYDDDTTEDVGFTRFAAKGITTSPSHGTPLALAHNGQPVTVSAGGQNADTDNLTVIFAEAKIGSTGYATLADALEAAANGTASIPTEIVILRDITTSEGYTIPNGKNIKLNVEAGKNITITASTGDFALLSVTAGSSLTLGSGGTLTLKGNNSDKGDVFVAGLLSLSGNAQIDTLTISADANSNGSVKIASDWSIANIGKLNLYGNGNTIESVIDLWKNKTVLQGNWLNASNVENMNFKLWNFIDASGHTQRINTPNPPDVPYGYMIDDSASNIGKLIVATFNIYLEARRYGEANTDTEIIVPYNYVMPRPLVIPAPGASGITLTIKSDTAAHKLSRGTQDTAADNGLFIVQNGIRLIFENIVIDGNQSAHSGNTASLVRVNSGGTFTMNTGAVLQNNRAANGGGVYVYYGTFNMNGGEISGNTATSGSSVYVYYGTFTMNSGDIKNNTNGGVHVYSGSTFTMSGGEISGNTRNSGGGVYVDGTFNMNNGTISGNTANGTGSNGGGGVLVGGGTFNMYGGVINSNKAAGNGGGVYVSSGTFTVGKTARVSGNTKTDNVTKSNVYLPSTYITLGAGANAPAVGMEIGVQTARADGVIVQYGATETIKNYFVPDEDGKSVNVLSGMLIIGNLSLTPAELDFYAQVQSYRTANANMTITVNEDLTLPVPVDIPAPGTAGITLTIKGNTGTRKLNRGAQDTIADSGLFIVPNGVRLVFESIVIDGRQGIHANNTASLVRINNGIFTMNTGAVLQNNRAASGGGVYVNNGTFNVNGGEISGNTATYAGGVYVVNNGTFNMSGGEISGNTARYGGGVLVSSGTFTMSSGKIIDNTGGGTYNGMESGAGGGVQVGGGTFNMSGGEISGNIANGTDTNGGGVYVGGGTFNMYGGIISGNKAAGNGGGVYNNNAFRVGGTAKVSSNTKTDNTRSNVYLPNTYITLGTGTNVPVVGMDISVQTTRTDGVIVQSGATAEIKAYFHADEDGKPVNFLSGQLIIGNLSLTPAELDFYEKVQSYGTATADVLIAVEADLTLPIPVNIPAPMTSGITLTIEGNTATRKLIRGVQDTNADNGLFVVPSGVRLAVENIVIDGNQGAHTGNTASLVRIMGGTFTMNTGAVLQNNRAAYGGGVSVNSGTFTMNSGEIKNNTATSSGGGVYVYTGTFNMNGGEIKNNTGGGVYVRSGTFTMSNGDIKDNTAADAGGVSVSGTFIMNKGTISGNTATSGSGGGVSIYYGGGFTMNGGAISGNTANGTSSTNGGGGVFNYGTFNMYGGEISGNRAAGNGGGVYNNGTFRVGGIAKVSSNTKTNNVTKSNVYLSNTYITFGTGINVPAVGMDISVQTTRADGVIAQSVTNGTVSTYFKADETGKSVIFDIDALIIK